VTTNYRASAKQRELPLGTRDEIGGGKRGAESPVVDEQLMEEVVARENLQAALRQVRRNGGSAGVDGMTVEELPADLKAHWPPHPSPGLGVDRVADAGRGAGSGSQPR
jgi:RNA-directed DNA polymerase